MTFGCGGAGAGAAGAAGAPSGPSLSKRATPCPPGHAARPTKRGSGSTEAASMPQISAARRVRVVSSIALKKATSRLPSSCGVASASSGVSTGTFRSKVTSCFEILMRLTASGSVSASRRFGCLISPARASSVSRSPYSRMSCAAVLSPMPGAPGTLSVESPASAWTSTTLSGPTPSKYLTTSSTPKRRSSREPATPAWPEAGSYIVTQGSTSCMRSLSAETIEHVRAGFARLAGVSGDEVVGLVAALLDRDHAEGRDRGAHQRELRHELVGRILPVAL